MATQSIDEKLSLAQAAISLPEVQEMVKRLAGYNLGVFMPHMHDAKGDMEPLPEGIVQVEDDLRVSFQHEDQVIDSPEKSYLPVGWRWSANSQSIRAATHCPVVKQQDGTYKHTGERKTN